MDSSRNPYLAIRAVNVYVRDQERSKRFFIDQLGFSLAYDARVQSGAVGYGTIRPTRGQQKAFPGSLELACMKHTHAILEGLHLAGPLIARRRARLPGRCHPRSLAVHAFLGRRSFRNVALVGTLRHLCLLLHGHGLIQRPGSLVSKLLYQTC